MKGRSGPPGNQNAFRHGLAGLIADKGGEANISTAMRVLAEVIASDAAWLVFVNRAIDGVMESNQKARANPKALATMDGYKRSLANSLTGNLQRFSFERVAKVETLHEIIKEMSEDAKVDGPFPN